MQNTIIYALFFSSIFLYIFILSFFIFLFKSRYKIKSISIKEFKLPLFFWIVSIISLAITIYSFFIDSKTLNFELSLFVIYFIITLFIGTGINLKERYIKNFITDSLDIYPDYKDINDVLDQHIKNNTSLDKLYTLNILHQKLNHYPKPLIIYIKDILQSLNENNNTTIFSIMSLFLGVFVSDLFDFYDFTSDVSSNIFSIIILLIGFSSVYMIIYSVLNNTNFDNNEKKKIKILIYYLNYLENGDNGFNDYGVNI